MMAGKLLQVVSEIHADKTVKQCQAARMRVEMWMDLLETGLEMRVDLLETGLEMWMDLLETGLGMWKTDPRLKVWRRVADLATPQRGHRGSHPRPR